MGIKEFTFPKTVYEAQDESLNIFQVDVTNACNAKCSYCPHPKHVRKRGMMTPEVFDHVLRAAVNRTIQLHHFGEPLLHPDLNLLIANASRRGFTVGFSTNGSLLTQPCLDTLIESGLQWIRLHTDPFGVRKSQFKIPEGFEFTEHGILVDNGSEKKDLVSFSGTVATDVPEQGGYETCSFVHDQWCVVLWDGTIATCCHDIEGVRSYGLCRQCNGYVFASPRVWGDYNG